jgi:hypothetical protein
MACYRDSFTFLLSVIFEVPASLTVKKVYILGYFVGQVWSCHGLRRLVAGFPGSSPGQVT